MTEFKEGDQLRVTMEVEYVGETDVWLDVKGTAIEKKFVTSIERIEPPVEVFGPGDVVRNPYTNQVFLLVPDGYVQVAPTVGQANPLDWGDGEPPETFTSETYERTTVTL